MKKISTLVLVLCLLVPALAACGEVSIRIPRDIMDKAIESNDATVLIRDYFYPLIIEKDDIAAMIFAAEFNISNGDPYSRDYGERGMFGKLVSAMTVLNNYETYEINLDYYRSETWRLMFGPWRDGRGLTKFTFASRKDVRELSYETGKWSPKKHRIPTIQIAHIVEYMGGNRRAHLACDYKALINDSYYLATFKIVR
jgi:hypothetical protein